MYLRSRAPVTGEQLNELMNKYEDSVDVIRDFKTLTRAEITMINNTSGNYGNAAAFALYDDHSDSYSVAQGLKDASAADDYCAKLGLSHDSSICIPVSLSIKTDAHQITRYLTAFTQGFWWTNAVNVVYTNSDGTSEDVQDLLNNLPLAANNDYAAVQVTGRISTDETDDLGTACTLSDDTSQILGYFRQGASQNSVIINQLIGEGAELDQNPVTGSSEDGALDYKVFVNDSFHSKVPVTGSFTKTASTSGNADTSLSLSTIAPLVKNSTLNTSMDTSLKNGLSAQIGLEQSLGAHCAEAEGLVFDGGEFGIEYSYAKSMSLWTGHTDTLQLVLQIFYHNDGSQQYQKMYAAAESYARDPRLASAADALSQQIADSQEANDDYDWQTNWQPAANAQSQNNDSDGDNDSSNSDSIIQKLWKDEQRDLPTQLKVSAGIGAGLALCYFAPPIISAGFTLASA